MFGDQQAQPSDRYRANLCIASIVLDVRLFRL